MIELLVTCLLASGITWVPPVGWTIESITARYPMHGEAVYCAGTLPCTSRDYRPEVKMRRSPAIGEAISVPSGCEVKAVTK